MNRLPKNGSDHFATITHLALTNELIKNHSPKADRDEIEEAEKLAGQSIKN